MARPADGNGRRAAAPAAPPFDRIPPHNVEAEPGVLGSVLISGDVLHEVAGLVAPDDFYRDAHRLIFGRMLDLYGRGVAVDALTVSDALAAAGELDAAGGDDYLAECVQSVPHEVNARYYAQIVRQKAV